MSRVREKQRITLEEDGPWEAFFAELMEMETCVIGFVGVGVARRTGLEKEKLRACGNGRSRAVRWNARMGRPGPGGAGKGADKGDGMAPSDEELSATITKVIEASFRKVR